MTVLAGVAVLPQSSGGAGVVLAQPTVLAQSSIGAVFAQVWGLCLVAFLLGALVTWLVMRPARRPAPPAAGDEGKGRVDPVQAAQAPPQPIPGVPRHARLADPALAGLERVRRRRRRGSSAVDALDRLRHPPDDPDPVIPRQPGPGGSELFAPREVPGVPPRRQPSDEE